MGKKRRGTAKTGDTALYNSREKEADAARTKSAAYNSDDDAMYNKVDRYHNAKEQEEFIRLNQGDGEESEDDDGISGRENVLDLGATVDDDDDSSSDDSDDNDDNDDSDNEPKSQEQELSSDSDSDDNEEIEEEQVRDWGKNVYGGDTADLEIGQEKEDAFLEEEAAKQVQAARYEDMDEDDFLSDDDDDDDSKDEPLSPESKKASNKKEQVDGSTNLVAAKRDLSKLSRSDKRKLLQSHHPELLPLVSHFSQVVEDWNGKTRIVANALLDGPDRDASEAVGATTSGLQYLVTKSAVQTSVALNVAMYLLLKTEQPQGSEQKDDMNDDDDKTNAMLDVGNGASSEEGDTIQAHPIMMRLQQLNAMAQKLEDRIEQRVDTLPEQMDNLVKASVLMQSEQGNEEENDTDDDSKNSDDTSLSRVHGEDDQDMEEAMVDDDNYNMSSEDEENDDDEVAQGVLNEAKFGLRPQEIDASTKRNKKIRRRPMPSDFGDEDNEKEEKDSNRNRKATQSLASTVNALEQRSQSRKPQAARNVEDVDEANADEDALRRGLEMMEEAIGAGSEEEYDNGKDDDDDSNMDDELKDGLDDDDDNNGDGGFYEEVKKKSKAKKEAKKSLYQVAPKYPVLDREVDGERALSQFILKNRGLVAHKNKMNRNPRVKKREQYRKALIRRKGAVREVRTEEGHKYGGETTGIKSGLSRSRKLGVK